MARSTEAEFRRAFSFFTVSTSLLINPQLSPTGNLPPSIGSFRRHRIRSVSSPHCWAAFSSYDHASCQNLLFSSRNSLPFLPVYVPYFSSTLPTASTGLAQPYTNRLANSSRSRIYIHGLGDRRSYFETSEAQLYFLPDKRRDQGIHLPFRFFFSSSHIQQAVPPYCANCILIPPSSYFSHVRTRWGASVFGGVVSLL